MESTNMRIQTWVPPEGSKTPGIHITAPSEINWNYFLLSFNEFNKGTEIFRVDLNEVAFYKCQAFYTRCSVVQYAKKSNEAL